jgi:hypothetical protein
VTVAKETRAHVASSFTILKGALIEESYSYFRSWDPQLSREQNLLCWKDRNPCGLPTQTWFRDVAFVLSRRFDPMGRDVALLTLAKGSCGLEDWKPILLWRMTRDEFVLRDFLTAWLCRAFEDGVYRIRAEDLYDHLHTLQDRGAKLGKKWSPTTIDRVAHALLVIAKDFGLLVGGANKEFATYHLPERSFLYLLHAMADDCVAPGKIVASPDWRMFLMLPRDVEQEILRLHQYRKLDYQVAGSLVQLTLPCGTAADYARSMVA